jgi:hypothetical protein
MDELVPIFLFMCIAGVLILRPLTKRLGLLLEALAKDRLAPARSVRAVEEAHLDQITTALERLNNRLDLVDDRLTFMERLTEERPRRRLTG